ncbi:class I SAM-dependent methyltransferase [Asaccharospora irregularis]|uniref:class I SAM-dependent methyltransferase n=1 Tax=Asaccharospora irregularis TaxID=29359 RepID=UPI0031D12C3E
MKSVLYHEYEPNADLTETSDDVKCFLDNIKYSIGSKILLVGNVGNLGKRLRLLGAYVTILEDSHYEDVCYSLIHNENCNVVKGSLEFLPFEDGCFDKVIILDHFNHTNNCEKASSEIYRVLKGCIIFSVDGNKKSIIVVRQKWTNYYQRYYFIKK